jgi:GT2 family glycosyltransferase
MKIAINLITWNGARFIRDCLDSVLAQTYTDYSVLVIDNGSTDDTLDIIRERYPQIKIVEHKANIGFARAHNEAIHWTRSDYVFPLNQDIVLEPDFLEKAMAFMETTPTAGAIAPKLLRWQEGQKTNFIDTVGLRVYRNGRVIDCGAGELDEGQYDAIEEVFGVSGAAPVYRRAALSAVAEGTQFFDEDFFSYKEDVDLSFRLRLAGWKIYRVPLAVAYHERTVSGSGLREPFGQIFSRHRQRSAFVNYYSYRNHLFVLLKNWPRATGRMLWYELRKFLFIIFFDARTFRAVLDFWRSRKKFLIKRQAIQTQKKIIEAEWREWLAK